MAQPPELQQLLALSRDRTAYQNPLFQAVSQMAYRGLPTYAREGTQLSGTLSNQAPAAAPQGGGLGLGGALGAAGLGALAGNALSGGGGELGKVLAGLKKLLGLGGGPNTVQGDRPFGGGAEINPTQGFDPNGFTGWDQSVSDPFGNPYLPSDPGFYTGTTYPTDPSGGTGIGPGMQQYYGGSEGFYGGSGGDSGPDDNWWHP